MRSEFRIYQGRQADNDLLRCPWRSLPTKIVRLLKGSPLAVCQRLPLISSYLISHRRTTYFITTCFLDSPVNLLLFLCYFLHQISILLSLLCPSLSTCPLKPAKKQSTRKNHWQPNQSVGWGFDRDGVDLAQTRNVVFLRRRTGVICGAGGGRFRRHPFHHLSRRRERAGYVMT